MNKSSYSFRVVEFIVRFIGLIIFGVLGFSFGGSIAFWLDPHDTAEAFLNQAVFALLGGLSGFILIPYFPSFSASFTVVFKRRK